MPIADLDHREYFKPAALEKLRVAFCAADVNHVGKLTLHELALAFRKIGRSVHKQKVRELAKTVVSDESGAVQFEEFCILEIMLSGIRPHVTLIDYRDYLSDERAQSLERRFVREDTEGVGGLPTARVVQICEEMGCRGMWEELGELCKQADVESTGSLEFHHLCAVYAVASKCRRKCNYREFLSGEQVASFRKIFSSATGESGTCSAKQLDKLMRRLGQNVKQSQLNWMMERFDLDGSGDIDFEEFCIMLLRLKGLRRQRTIGPQTQRCEDLWRSEGFTIKELQRSGFTLKHFKEVGIPVAKIIAEGGVSPLDFRRAGYTPQDLRRGGVGASELRRCGFSLADLRLAGFSDAVLQMADRELKGCMSAGDLSLLAQRRPLSSSSSATFGRPSVPGRPVRGAVLSAAGASALAPVVSPSPSAAALAAQAGKMWNLPQRCMTPMIREHTDWQPKLSRLSPSMCDLAEGDAAVPPPDLVLSVK